MSELQQLRPGDAFASRYRVVRLIRAGGMGAVYEVEDTSTRRRRALKIMHPSLVQSADSRARFEREVFIGAELETEHVVEVLDAGLDQQSQMPFLTMELLKGEELGDRLLRVGRVSPQEAVEVLGQIARALDKAHARGIVHRDLKPENVYLTFREDGSMRAKILDFGIAKLLEGANASATQAAGTPLYMAPEQTDRAGHVSPATDIWALGLVAYRMVVGASYWQGESLQQLYRQILMDPLTSPAERATAYGVQLPPAFDGWFGRCVARNPQERWPSASAAVVELANAFGVQVPRSSGASHPGSPAYDVTAPPVTQVTPAGASHPMSTPFGSPQMAATTPHTGAPFGSTPLLGPHGQMTPQPGTTPYPSPNFTPPHAATPVPQEISGTQVAAPGQLDWRGSGPGAPAPQPSAPRKGSPVPLVVGGLAALLLVGGIGAYVATRPSTPKPDPDPKPQPTTHAPKPKPTTAAVKKDFAGEVAKLNVFHGVGSRPHVLQEHEVTREEFARYLASNPDARKPLQGFSDLEVGGKDGRLPVTWVTYEAADAYCQAIGGRLPTVDEWEAAVKGPSGWKYPWGNDWPKGADLRDLAAAKGQGAGLVEVGSSPFDKGPYGHLDLAGNAQEWTATDAPTKGHKLLRGTDVNDDQTVYADPGELFTEAGNPDAVDSAKAGAQVGFRCAKDK